MPSPWDVKTVDELIVWVKSRIEHEVTNRPDLNIHKVRLERTWNQVLVKLESMK